MILSESKIFLFTILLSVFNFGYFMTKSGFQFLALPNFLAKNKNTVIFFIKYLDCPIHFGNYFLYIEI